MPDNPPVKGSSNDLDSLVGQAWSQHFHGKNEDAVKAFQDILARNADHVDANFGLGLTLRALGRAPEAREAFMKAKQLLTADQSAQSEDDFARVQMLTRMIDQNIVRLG